MLYKLLLFNFQKSFYVQVLQVFCWKQFVFVILDWHLLEFALMILIKASGTSFLFHLKLKFCPETLFRLVWLIRELLVFEHKISFTWQGFRRQFVVREPNNFSKSCSVTFLFRLPIYKVLTIEPSFKFKELFPEA